MSIAIAWDSLALFHELLVGIAISGFSALALNMSRPRVNLIFGRANNSRNVVSGPSIEANVEISDTEIYVEKFFLQNVGKKPATNVEFVLSDFPSDISVWQPRETEFKSIEKGHCLIKIPQIAPLELVIVDCAYINQRPASVTSVKCAEVVGKEVPFTTYRRWPPVFHYVMQAFMLLGFAFIVLNVVKILGVTL